MCFERMMTLEMLSNKVHKVVIIGSGPAGHTAAIYTGRALLEPIMFEGEFAAGVAAGGQLTTTTDVENFPGFPNGIMGPELMMNMRQQAINCGAQVFTKTVDKLDLSKTPYKVFIKDTVIETDAIIIATGATAKRLGVPGEETYWQKGMSACAVCDGGLPIFRNKPLVVVGGGDSAVEEAVFLTKYGSKVTMLVRRDVLRASAVMQERALNNDKIEILWHTELKEVRGNDKVMTEAVITNTQTGVETVLEAAGLFYAIGHVPNTAFLGGQIDLDETGYIVVSEKGTTKTNVPGVFACGDVQDKTYRQAITAAGSGCMAAMEVEHYGN